MSDEFKRILAAQMQDPSNSCLVLSEGQLAHTITEDITLLEWDDVILAIAAMWQGVAGANLFYSFGSAEMFETASVTVVAPEEICVPNSDTLIIPMNSGTVVIAISEPSNNELVRFIFLQSRAGSAPRIRRDARAVVENVGWLPADSNPRFVNSSDLWVTAPPASQPNNIDTAGHHVVLNAWAYMLDIPIARTMCDLTEEERNQFYSGIQGLMNLAYSGRLNRELVRAFMHEYGYDDESNDSYAERRIQDNHQRELLEHSRSVHINPEIFANILAALRADPNTRHIETTIPPATSHNVSNIVSGIPVPTASLPSPTGPVPSQPGAVLPQSGAVPSQPATVVTASSWREILDNNLRTFESRVQALPKPDSTISERRIAVPDGHNYHDLHVELAIHSVWYPLLKQNGRYAMGEGTTYHQRDLDMAELLMAWPIGDRSMPFIMPLRGQLPTFEDTQDIEDGGHWLLAVAEMDKTVDQQVNIRILNSIRQTPPGAYTETEKVVRYSGWLGVEKDGSAPLLVDVTFTHEAPVVPQQSGQPSCGFHTVIAAWATMLGIPINPTRKLRGQAMKRKEFYAVGTRLINCALAGCMNSRTIQAFFNVYGFSVEQTLAERCPDINMTRIMTSNIHIQDYATERTLAYEAQIQEDLDKAMAASMGQDGDSANATVASLVD